MKNEAALPSILNFVQNIFSMTNTAEIKIRLFREIDNLPEQYLFDLQAMIERYVAKVQPGRKPTRKPRIASVQPQNEAEVIIAPNQIYYIYTPEFEPGGAEQLMQLLKPRV